MNWWQCTNRSRAGRKNETDRCSSVSTKSGSRLGTSGMSEARPGEGTMADGSCLGLMKACAKRPRKWKGAPRHFYGGAEAPPFRHNCEGCAKCFDRIVRERDTWRFVHRKKQIPRCASG